MGTVHEMRQSDSGAPALSGTVGTMLNVLDAAIVLGKCYTTPDDAAWTDRSAEARLTGGVAFALLPTPAAGDRCYVGAPVKFFELDTYLSTLGVGGTYVIEYRRNDSTWATLTVTDGTSGFTQNGKITWADPGNWATVAVNSVTQYWIRIRASANPSTVPTVFAFSVFGWNRAFEGTNKAIYRANSGARLYYRVQDDGPGTHGGREARLTGSEGASDVDTQTALFPTVAQLAAGIIPRKSASADGTARNWRIVADDRTVKWHFATTDVAGVYASGYFGEIFSFVTGDLYNGIVIGKNAEGATAAGPLDSLAAFSGAGTIIGHYVCRAYTGVGTSLACGKHGDAAKGSTTVLLGTVQYPNGADGGLHLSPIWVHEVAAPTVRGLLRGFWHYLHALAATADDDIFAGAGDFAGKSFKIIKQGVNGSYVEEVSDTWRKN